MSDINFARSPRLIEKISTREIEIDAAPSIGQKPYINYFTVLLPPIAMIVLMYFISKRSNGSNYMGFMFGMMFIGVIVSIINYSSQVKKFRDLEALRKEKYEKYLISKRQEILRASDQQRDILNRINPDINECINIILKRNRRLWERTIDDSDFMSLCVGTGEGRLGVRIKIPKVGFTISEDEYLRTPEKIKNECSTLKDVPIVCDMKKYPSCGIVGDYKAAANLVRCMLINAVTHHGYDDLKIVGLFSRDHYNYWAWMRWLPHTNDESGEYRYLACGQFDANDLLGRITPIIRSRIDERRDQGGNTTMALPYYLFVIDDISLIETHPITRFLMEDNERFGFGYIIISPNMTGLPHNTKQILNLNLVKGACELFVKEDGIRHCSFLPEKVELSRCDSAARALAPVKLVSAFDSCGKLPTMITFLEGYGVKKPSELDLGLFWDNARAEKTMEVPIGISGSGERFCFDINEKKHGPHGIVAGTTGSGKSEMIQSWILSMAIQFSPSDVSFVLIDFKGTGLILPFLSLPHLAGTISDLDSNISRNLIALRAELQRRKALFDRAGTNNIAGYLNLYHSGKVTEPLSYLFVIIDEYAEFKANYPEFTAEVNSLFRTGRALGVHIILLTQNPSGVISGESESNVQFRWCLRVAGVAASREILGGHSEAAKITNPGRAYVRVGTDDIFEQIQSFYSGAPYFTGEQKKDISINQVDISGKRTPLYRERKQKIQRGTEIGETVQYIKEYAKRRNIKNARQVWMGQLPNTVFLSSKSSEMNEEILNPVVGLLDDPWEQRQYPFRLPISEEGHVVLFGAPQSGKTTFLQTCIMSMCSNYTPDRVNLYVMDFGSWSMKIFKDFPHVGAVAYSNEDVLIQKIAKLIEEILNVRKNLFAKAGVGSIQSYNRIGKEILPYVVLVIDNYTPILQVFPQLEGFFVRLTREGGNYGVYLIASCSGTNGLGYKMQQNIKTKVALQMTDTTDYAGIVGKTGGLVPMSTVGRGLFKATRVLEFQTALPVSSTDESERSRIIRECAAKYAAEWTGKTIDRPKIMPDEITFGSIRSEKGFVLGLDYEEIEPVVFNYNDEHLMLISMNSKRRSNEIIGLMLKQSDEAKVSVYGENEDNYREYGDGIQILKTGADIDLYLEELSNELQKRKDLLENDQNANPGENIILIIDGIKRCFDEMNQDSLNRLNAFAQIGKGLKVTVIAFEDSTVLNPLKGYVIILNRMASSQMMLLGGTIAEHELAETGITSQERYEEIKNTDGYYITEGKAVKFKIMSLEDKNE